ncbi:MAG TPA: hypothetical protein VGK31_02990 [Thermoanaerobaculia bacterium]
MNIELLGETEPVLSFNDRAKNGQGLLAPLEFFLFLPALFDDAQIWKKDQDHLTRLPIHEDGGLVAEDFELTDYLVERNRQGHSQFASV